MIRLDDLDAIRRALDEAEAHLETGDFAELPLTERDGRSTRVVLTRRFYRLALRARLWRAPALAVTLKNAGYGFDPARARSLGGRDGVFLLDRGHDNAMTRKIFDRFLDRADSSADDVAEFLKTTRAALHAIRLVSHHLRLLGVLHRAATIDWIVIVDFDRRE